MRRSQRYEIVSTWTPTERWSHGESLFDSDRDQFVVEIAIADIRDTQGGHIYLDGAHRVKAFKNGKPYHGKVYKRTKTFYGELAWADSERLYRDTIHEIEMTAIPAW